MVKEKIKQANLIKYGVKYPLQNREIYLKSRSSKHKGFIPYWKTSELIPLCHPLPIDHTATKIIMNEVDNSLEVFCVVSAVAKTGVEMEAIMGVNAALITIYDLSKIVNPHLKIDNVKLLIKEGGKSGLWTNPDGLPEFLKNIF